MYSNTSSRRALDHGLNGRSNRKGSERQGTCEESPTSISQARRSFHDSARFLDDDLCDASNSNQMENMKSGKKSRGKAGSSVMMRGNGSHAASERSSQKSGNSRTQGISMASNKSPIRSSDSSVTSSKSRNSNASKAGGSKTLGSSARGKQKKLDAKVFAFSMELIEHVSKGRLELAQKKINQGASPDYADYDKRTPLHLAASEGHLDVVKMLLENGANADVEDRWGSRPYDDAVKNGFGEIVDILEEASGVGDAHILTKEQHDGLELLEYAARGFEGHVREKIAAGTKATFADFDRRTPLHLAACEGHAKIVEILLMNGADASFKDRFGHTAVEDAMCNGFLDVLKVMERCEVKIPGHIFDQSFTPEFERNMKLIDACAKGNIGGVQKLLTEGADARFEDYDLRTPLHLACAEGHANVVKLLIGAGADVSAEDRWNATPFDEAIKYSHDDVVRMLEGGGM